MVEQPAQDNDKEATPFNMAMLFYINLNSLIQAKDAAYMGNDMQAWYKGLNRIHNKVCFKLNKDEQAEIKKLFEDALSALNADVSKASKTLQDIDFKLVAFMDKYNMIFPRIDNTSGADRLKKRYNIA